MLLQKIVEFLILTKIVYFSLFALILWNYYIFDVEKRGIKRLVFFPITEHRPLFNPKRRPDTIPLAFNYILIFQVILMFITGLSPVTSLIFWCIFLFYLCFIISQYIFYSIKYLPTITITVCGIVMIISSLITLQVKNFELMNVIDFTVHVYVFLGSLFIIGTIVVKEKFEEKLIDFFVFFGLLILSFLQIIATVPIAKDFFQYMDVGIIATLITVIFWIISVPWIIKLRCKLSSI